MLHNIINAFRSEMRSMLQVSSEKTERDVKTLRDELSELKAKKRELEGLIQVQEARIDSIIIDNKRTQSGNINNIKEIWQAVHDLEKRDINAAIDDRVWEQTQDLRETIENQRDRLNVIEIQLEQPNDERGVEIEDIEPHVRPENIESRLTAIEQ